MSQAQVIKGKCQYFSSLVLRLHSTPDHNEVVHKSLMERFIRFCQRAEGNKAEPRHAEMKVIFIGGSRESFQVPHDF
jgi:hypothetical protein